MPSAKSGTAGTVVPPSAPEEAYDADTANPGEVEQSKALQRESKTGKYGSQPVQPYEPPKNEEEDKVKTSWVEIVLVDKNKNPVAGAKYEVKLPDGKVKKGTLDGKGFARISAIDPGTCQITFPEYAPNSWKRA